MMCEIDFDSEDPKNDLVLVYRRCAKDIRNRLDKISVVLKVDRELPENPFDKSCGLNESAHNGFEVAELSYRRAGYSAWEPLIEEG